MAAAAAAVFGGLAKVGRGMEMGMEWEWNGKGVRACMHACSLVWLFLKHVRCLNGMNDCFVKLGSED